MAARKAHLPAAINTNYRLTVVFDLNNARHERAGSAEQFVAVASVFIAKKRVLVAEENPSMEGEGFFIDGESDLSAKEIISVAGESLARARKRVSAAVVIFPNADSAPRPNGATAYRHG